MRLARGSEEPLGVQGAKNNGFCSVVVLVVRFWYDFGCNGMFIEWTRVCWRLNERF